MNEFLKKREQIDRIKKILQQEENYYDNPDPLFFSDWPIITKQKKDIQKLSQPTPCHDMTGGW